MRIEKLKFRDDPTAQGLFTLAGAALANPGNVEARRTFWKFVDTYGSHEWVLTLKRSAAASHPGGLAAGNEKISTAIEDGNHRPYAGQPDWLRGVFKAFE